MYCIQSEQTLEEIIKKSRFIGVIAPCASEQQLLTCLQQLHERHPNASHIAFAYRIKTNHGFVTRFNDAGEPSGTAGKPIYQHLQGKNLVNVLIAVIRYFGGVKLGAGGLTRAYANSAKKVIEKSTIIDFIEFVTVSVTLDYAQLQNFAYQLTKLQGTIVKQTFTEQVELCIRLPEQQKSALKTIIPR